MTTSSVDGWDDFLAGDLDAFARLVDHFQRDVFAVALATVLDAALAEDVAQETFLVAFERRAQLRNVAALGGWLAQIARNLARDTVRKRRREELVERVEMSAPLDSDGDTDGALARTLEATVARLPPRYREVLVLYYAHERSVASIATSLGLTETATMQRLSRGRKLIRERTPALQQLAARRPRRAFTLSVLALLALRRQAHASPTRAPRRTSRIAIALAAVLGVVQSDGKSRAQSPVPAFAHASAPERDPAATVPPEPVTVTRTPRDDRRRDRVTLPARVALPRRVEPPARVAVSGEPAAGCHIALPAPPPEVPRGVSPPPSSLPYDQVTGFLETAALPRAGEVSYETIGLAMVVRGGLSRHVAVHVGMTGMETDRGTPKANANPAFGGGVKVGGRVSRHAAFAVLAEGAREVNLKTTELHPGWLGRAYLAATLGTAMTNMTLIGGVVGEYDGTNRWHSPLLGIAATIGWDEQLAFVLETQRFMTPRDALRGTSVAAVRFRLRDITPTVLGIDRVRIDAGMMTLDHENDDYDLLPWLQVGLGW